MTEAPVLQNKDHRNILFTYKKNAVLSRNASWDKLCHIVSKHQSKKKNRNVCKHHSLNTSYETYKNRLFCVKVFFFFPRASAAVLPWSPHGVWGDRRCTRGHVMAVLGAQRRESRTGDQQGKLSIGGWHNLEAAVQLHCLSHRRGAFARHLWGRGSCHVRSGLSQRAWMRRIEVNGVDLGHAGSQVAEEASPHLCVHSFTRGQEAGDLSDALAETGSVFPQNRRVCVHRSCRGKHMDKYTDWLTDGQTDGPGDGGVGGGQTDRQMTYLSSEVSAGSWGVSQSSPGCRLSPVSSVWSSKQTVTSRSLVWFPT